MDARAANQAAESAVRAVAAATKALRLYPPTSPIPRQSIDDGVAAISRALEDRPVLPLVVGRDGFDLDGSPLAPGAPGISDLADALRAHGIAELTLMPGCSGDDLSTLLELVGRDPDELTASGGLAAQLAAAGVDGVRVAEVELTVAMIDALDPGEDAEAFLRDLAMDSDKLAAWLAAAAAGDPAAFTEGLEELVAAAGTEGYQALAANLASAFRAQGPEVRDALLGGCMEHGPVHELARVTFGHLDGTEIADALCTGTYGENMLSLSNALVRLPLQQRIDEVRARVQTALAEQGHTDKEAHFLEHMLEVRSSPNPETALSQTELYGAVARALSLDPADVDLVRENAMTASRTSDAAGTRTMLILLDQQSDLALYQRSADSLAAMVPRLLDGGELELATRVVSELSARGSAPIQPWPELAEHLRAAVAAAYSTRSAETLLSAVASNPGLMSAARSFVRVAPDPAGPPVLSAALTRGEDFVTIAEELLGVRFAELLAAALPSLPWFQLRIATQRLAATGDGRWAATLSAAAHRPDEQARREVAAGLAAAGTPEAVNLLSGMVRDQSTEVAIIAVRAMAKHRTAGAGGLLAQRLSELEIDGKDFLLGREIIGALARVDEPEALAALKALEGRRALIKRGHFGEVQQLARQALDLKARKGGA